MKKLRHFLITACPLNDIIPRGLSTLYRLSLTTVAQIKSFEKPFITMITGMFASDERTP